MATLSDWKSYPADIKDSDYLLDLNPSQEDIEKAKQHLINLGLTIVAIKGLNFHGTSNIYRLYRKVPGGPLLWFMYRPIKK